MRIYLIVKNSKHGFFEIESPCEDIFRTKTFSCVNNPGGSLDKTLTIDYTLILLNLMEQNKDSFFHLYLLITFIFVFPFHSVNHSCFKEFVKFVALQFLRKRFVNIFHMYLNLNFEILHWPKYWSYFKMFSLFLSMLKFEPLLGPQD